MFTVYNALTLNDLRQSLFFIQKLLTFYSYPDKVSL